MDNSNESAAQFAIQAEEPAGRRRSSDRRARPAPALGRKVYILRFSLESVDRTRERLAFRAVEIRPKALKNSARQTGSSRRAAPLSK
ncbi:MAG: hypothetical protein C3F11_02370 [Methylocystaceae bacterium]|nr:MAG: hypothetical protein C3F11_02370 [Methylocystaceae bacterium]